MSIPVTKHSAVLGRPSASEPIAAISAGIAVAVVFVIVVVVAGTMSALHFAAGAKMPA